MAFYKAVPTARRISSVTSPVSTRQLGNSQSIGVREDSSYRVRRIKTSSSVFDGQELDDTTQKKELGGAAFIRLSLMPRNHGVLRESD